MACRRLIKGLTRIGHLYCCIWQRTQHAAIQTNEALADQVFAAQQADKDAIAKKAAERAADDKRREAARERAARAEKETALRDHMRALHAQVAAVEQKQRQDLDDQRSEAKRARVQARNALVREQATEAARKAAALDYRRALLSQIESEQRHIRLGAGQYGLSVHELKVNAPLLQG